VALTTKAKYEYSYTSASSLHLLGILQNILYLINLLQRHIIAEHTKCYLLMPSVLYDTFFSLYFINHRLLKK